jgi:peptidyl-prolyl cis-trans isomerase D
MRKHAKYFYVLFFIVILTFIFWGVGRVDHSRETDIVARVGKYKITAEDYWKAYDNVYRFYREIYKERFDEEMEKKLNLKETVLNSMINERILLIAAKETGIKVSDEELFETIMNDPTFKKDGIFNKYVYLNRLKLNRITPEAYENAKRQELTVKKMINLIETSADLTDIDNLPEVKAGDEQLLKMLSQSIASDKKEKAVKAYIEGLKKNIKISINKQLISRES